MGKGAYIYNIIMFMWNIHNLLRFQRSKKKKRKEKIKKNTLTHNCTFRLTLSVGKKKKYDKKKMAKTFEFAASINKMVTVL